MSELPKGWKLDQLTNICDVSTGKVDANHATTDGKYTFFTCAFEPFKSPTFSFEGELITLPGNGANVGHVNYYKGQIEAYQRTYVLHGIKILPKYLYWQLKSEWKKTNLDKQFGSATNYLKIGNFKNYSLPIAPLNEQIRIANKLDSILAKVDAAQARFDKIPNILKRFRQSVLAAATSGELTKEWRDENQVLINDWESVVFSELSREITVGFVGKMSDKYKESGIPFLRSQNVRAFRFDSKNLLYIDDEFHNKIYKSRLEKGDLAVVRSGAPGTTCVIPESLGVANCSDLVIVRPNERLLSEYGCIYMNSSIAQKNVSDNKVGVAQQHFNVGSMKLMPISLPAIAEQKEIVRRVESLFTMADTVEKQYFDAKTRTNRLTQSILAKAFRGELVLQNENDEPAEVLLAKIKVISDAVVIKKKN